MAHEIGHNLGFFHDYEETKLGRKNTCGVGKWRNGTGNYLMNYIEPIQNEWSECSNDDFKNYYSRVTAKCELAKCEFCLKTGDIFIVDLFLIPRDFKNFV